MVRRWRPDRIFWCVAKVTGCRLTTVTGALHFRISILACHLLPGTAVQAPWASAQSGDQAELNPVTCPVHMTTGCGGFDRGPLRRSTLGDSSLFAGKGQSRVRVPPRRVL